MDGALLRSSTLLRPTCSSDYLNKVVWTPTGTTYPLVHADESHPGAYELSHPGAHEQMPIFIKCNSDLTLNHFFGQLKCLALLCQADQVF